MNAVWARHVTDEVEGFLSQDQYDLASKAQQKLDKAIKQDAVQTVVKVCPAPPPPPPKSQPVAVHVTSVLLS